MKQTEILDLLLKGLYEEGKDKFCSLGMIVNKYNIPINTIDELRRLAKRLESDGLVKNPIYTRSDITVYLSSYGIDYCEGDSYTYRGKAIITNHYNINIENSSDTMIVAQSENIQLNTTKAKLESELNSILEYINNSEIEVNIKYTLLNRIKTIIQEL